MPAAHDGCETSARVLPPYLDEQTHLDPSVFPPPAESSKEDPCWIRTGIASFDGHFCRHGANGLRGLVTIVGPPGAGKTVLVLSMLERTDSLFISTGKMPVQRMKETSRIRYATVTSGMYMLMKHRIPLLLSQEQTIKAIAIDSMPREEIEADVGKAMRELVAAFGVVLLVICEVSDIVDATDGPRFGRRWRMGGLGPEKVLFGTRLVVERMNYRVDDKIVRRLRLEGCPYAPTCIESHFEIHDGGVSEVEVS